MRAAAFGPAVSTLRHEVIGDGVAGCLEKALQGARDHHELVFMHDRRSAAEGNPDRAGHVVIRDPASGRVWDPNDGPPPRNPAAWPHRNPTAWAAAQGVSGRGPAYREAGAVAAGEASAALALPPGEARNAALAKNPALRALAGMRVADDPNPPAGAAAGLALPRPANVVGGTHGTGPETALKILETMSDGKPPFKPSAGLGGVQWFVTEGNPFTGDPAGRSAVIPVDIEVPKGAPVFREADLLKIFDAEMPAASEVAEAQLRKRLGLGNDAPLNAKQRRTVLRNAERMAEKAMWEKVGQRVAGSRPGVGKVVLEGSRFSKQGNGVFTLSAKPQTVRIRGGASALVDVLKKTGQPVDDGVVAAAKNLAAQQGMAGKLSGVVKVGGRVLVIVGAAMDGYRIYRAEDKVRETAKVAGGWAGATAAGGAFASWASPSLATGPWGWLGYGLGTVGAGAVGYFAGESVAEEVYELVVDGDPLYVGRGD